ncbi:hypothetical protein H2199_000889 [Coniosporium tulheliwenetii]|uniref:Uncharacterized protein n=1 Tax=Coniosporium tulheliwenetii TaxID=3383036 RepID=A0ACC2ZN50_9PEZI|nr:hypothetical protein H2199_000889 [Cladosporium sp. JES 115]
MTSSFSGRVFVVTGSASGMGLATAKPLLERGASLGLCDLNGASLEKLFNSLPEEQKSRVIIQIMTSRTAVLLDGVANIAGTGGHKLGLESIWETEDKEFEYIVDALKPDVLEEPGSVVHISSMFSMRGYPQGAVFSASKHAAVRMVKSAAMEVGERNIRVNVVMPDAIDTPMTHAMRGAGAPNPVPNYPIPRLGTPQENANVVAFLLSEESSFVTGATWAVDGGAIA